jgi:hypothetical protein
MRGSLTTAYAARDRVIVEQRTEVLTAMGANSSYATQTEVWGSVTPYTVREQSGLGAKRGEAEFKVLLRGFTLPIGMGTHRIRFGIRLLEIVVPPERGENDTVLYCKEGKA